MNKAFPELSRALSDLLDQMDASIRKGDYDGPTIKMFLAGGMAVNFYCGTRYTEDVDAFYTRRVQVGPCEVSYTHKDGKPSFLYLDNNYNPTFGLLHEHRERDDMEWTGIGNEKRKLHLFVQSAVDLAVTKISRLFAPGPRGHSRAVKLRSFLGRTASNQGNRSAARLHRRPRPGRHKH